MIDWKVGDVAVALHSRGSSCSCVVPPLVERKHYRVQDVNEFMGAVGLNVGDHPEHYWDHRNFSKLSKSDDEFAARMAALKPAPAKKTKHTEPAL